VTIEIETWAFDDTLRLARAGAGLWTSHTDKRFWNAIGPFGGWTAALLMKAVLAEPERRGDPVAMTVNFIAGLKDAALDVRTTCVRQGRSMEFWNAEIVQDGAVCAQAMLSLAPARESARHAVARMPDAPAPEAIEPPAERRGFGRMFETRPVTPFLLDDPRPFEERVRTLVWTHDAERRPLDYVLLACLADAFSPRAFMVRPRPTAVSTITMSIYFPARAEELAAAGGDFILAEANARQCGHGFCDQHGALWRRDGVLLATTEQLIWFK
jgi:acyl-CoA thioesterase